MGTVILIRHARSTANASNILAGQSPGVRLDPTGVEQSKSLADLLGELPINRVFVSPLERCIDTISPWLTKYGNSVEVHSEPRIIEPDYGTWSGRSLEELALEKLWSDVQHNPAEVTFPSGEKFADVWNRVADFYAHGDIIKFLIANVLNIRFEHFQALVVEPASISIAQFSEKRARLVQFNRSAQEIDTLVRSLSPTTLGGESGQKFRSSTQGSN